MLIDLLSIDGWWQKGGLETIVKVPELIAYVYHHLYGALVVNNDRIENVAKIFNQKIPIEQPGIKYGYLYEKSSVTAHITSLGRDCYQSFNYLLTAYNRWDWIGLLFKNEQEFKRALVSYQMAINLLFYFYMVKNKVLPLNKDNIAGKPIIPPSFSNSDRETLQYCYHFMIKSSGFFKNYISEMGITEKEILEQWDNYLNIMGGFTNVGFLQAYDKEFMENLLK